MQDSLLNQSTEGADWCYNLSRNWIFSYSKQQIVEPVYSKGRLVLDHGMKTYNFVFKIRENEAPSLSMIFLKSFITTLSWKYHHFGMHKRTMNLSNPCYFIWTHAEALYCSDCCGIDLKLNVPMIQKIFLSWLLSL